MSGISLATLTSLREKKIEFRGSRPLLNQSFLTTEMDGSIHECVILNNSELLALRLIEGPDIVNELDKDGLSALHYAVRYNNIKCVKTILDTPGVDVNVVGAQGAQPIHYAAKFFKDQKQHGRNAVTDSSDSNEEDDIITLLLHHGANINALDAYKLTPLRYAAQKGSVPALTTLLKNKDIDVKNEDSSGATALHCACLKGHLEAAMILIEHDEKTISSEDKKGMNPLHHAAVSTNGYEVLCRIFAREKDNKTNRIPAYLTLKNKNSESMLYLAVGANSYNTSKLLINEGANVNEAKTSNGKTPLHLAAAKAADIEIVKLLVDNGADVQMRDAIEETPLHKAARAGKEEVVKYLLQKGSEVDAEDHDWQTALIEASAKNNRGILQILLDHGAKINILDRFHKSPVYWAAENNAVDVLKVLLPGLQQHNCMNLLEVPDTFSNSPLHIAAMKGHHEVVSLLIEYGAEVDSRNDQDLTPLHSATTMQHVKVAEILLKHKPSLINDRTGSENTCLHLAAMKGHHKMLTHLLKCGAHIDAKDSVGMTPLSHAAKLGHVECVKVLLENRAATSIKDLNGRTAMFLACINGHHEAMKQLLDYKAHVDLLDNDKKSMLDIAIANRQRNTVELLLEHEQFFSLMSKTCIRRGKRTTPMREMIVNLPDVAYKVLNKCMANSVLDENEVELNYELIDDRFAPWNKFHSCRQGMEEEKTDVCTTYQIQPNFDVENQQQQVLIREKKKKNRPKKQVFEQEHVLSVMCKEANGNLLSHPVVSSLIEEKWKKFGPAFYLNFAIFALFLFFLTAFLIVVTPSLSVYELVTTDLTYRCKQIEELNTDSINYMVFVKIGSCVVIVFSCLLLMVEVIQMLNRRLSYITDPVNWLECTLYTMALFYVGKYDVTASKNCEYSSLIRQLGACTVFLAWVDLLLFTRKFASIGIYIVMFSDVLKTFVKFSITFLMFVMAFAVVFYSFFTEPVFENIRRALVKTSAMTIGEFGFDELFKDRKNVAQPVVAWIFFFVFLIVMTILLMNMLVGLAVDDIKAVLEKAVITRIIMRVQLVLDVEKRIPYQFQKRIFVKTKKIKCISGKKNFFKKGLTLEEIEEARKCTKLKQE